MKKRNILLFILITLILFSCSRRSNQNHNVPLTGEETLPDLAEAIAFLSQGAAGIYQESPAFIMELHIIVEQDPYFFFLVDKQNHLPLNYEPDDLVPLRAGSFRITRDDLTLRRAAAQALEEMAAAARADGVILTVGSAYRSAARQAEIYSWNVRTYGQEAASRQSAQPGTSQHQLGTVVDFSPIDDSFALTQASSWLVENASRFGWSLSYPDGYEDITGYRWESWHYRYVGRDLSAFIDTYFDGIQQYALEFIQSWQ